MWKSIKNATTSKSVDYSHSTISAPLDAPPASQPNASLGAVSTAEPPRKPSRMSFSGIAKGMTGNRSRSASPAADRSPGGPLSLDVPAHDQHRAAQSLFASEPSPVPSPPKPPKPQFVAQNSEQFRGPDLNAPPGLNDQNLGSTGSVGSAGAYLNTRTNSIRAPDPRQAGYPPLPVDSQSVRSAGGNVSAARESAGNRETAGVAQQAQQAQLAQQSVPASGASVDSRSSSPEKKKANSVSLNIYFYQSKII